MSTPITAVDHYDEFMQTTKNGTPNQFWGKMPRRMLEKCAEAAALLKDFTNEISGLYIAEEMPEEKIVIDPGDTPMQGEPETLAYTAKPGQKKLLLEVLTEMEIEDIEQMKNISEALKDNRVPCAREAMREFILGMLEVKG